MYNLNKTFILDAINRVTALIKIFLNLSSLMFHRKKVTQGGSTWEYVNDDRVLIFWVSYAFEYVQNLWLVKQISEKWMFLFFLV